MVGLPVLAALTLFVVVPITAQEPTPTPPDPTWTPGLPGTKSPLPTPTLTDPPSLSPLPTTAPRSPLATPAAVSDQRLGEDGLPPVWVAAAIGIGLLVLTALPLALSLLGRRGTGGSGGEAT